MTISIERSALAGGVITREGEEPGHLFVGHSSELERAELQEILRSFRIQYSVKRIVGILGGSDAAAVSQRSLVQEFLSGMDDFRVGVLSGGTKGGLPQIAVEEAKSFGLPSIGVFPSDRRKLALLDQLDLAIETPPPLVGNADFGTETPTLVRIPDAVVVISGGVGTLTEVATILKMNKGLLKKGFVPVYIVPIYGSGGVADHVHLLLEIDDIRRSLPSFLVRNGSDAALFLRSVLS